VIFSDLVNFFVNLEMHVVDDITKFHFLLGRAWA